jgi:hypothetical protein
LAAGRVVVVKKGSNIYQEALISLEQDSTTRSSGVEGATLLLLLLLLLVLRLVVGLLLGLGLRRGVVGLLNRIVLLLMKEEIKDTTHCTGRYHHRHRHRGHYHNGRSPPVT